MRILIANPFGIGDVLFSLPLVRSLRQAFPDAILGYLCNRRTAELVSSWPELNGSIVFEKDEFRQAWKRSQAEGTRWLRDLVGQVRQQRFDLLFDLSLGWHLPFGALLAGIPKRIGFDFRGRGRFLTHRLPISGFHDQPVADYYLDLLSVLGIPPQKLQSHFIHLSEEARENARTYLVEQGIAPDKPLVGIVPGGGASWGPNATYKHWPTDRFAQVADSIADEHQVDILLIGDSSEALLCQEVAKSMRHLPKIAVQVPSLTLLAALLKRCHLVVGNDGGTLHLANVVGTRTVSIFGPVDGSVYGPYPAGKNNRVVSKGLACRPCYQGFRFPPCPWHNACLKQLEVKPVLEAVHELLG